ncbi:MAG: site-specific integrase [Solirubrobacterales bacterium]|nr:site-specific integrase [Solirubrobacterales bacterium]
MRGSTRKRGKTWTAYWDVTETDPETGEQVRRQRSKGGFRTQKLAEAHIGEVLPDVRAGTYVEPTTQTLADFMLNDWLPGIKNTIRPTTQNRYLGIVQRYIKPHPIGRIPLSLVSPADINKLYADLEKCSRPGCKHANPDVCRGLAANTLRSIHTVLSRCLSDAVRWEKVKRNAAKLADPPALSRKRAQAWSPRELRQFLAAVEHDRLSALWRLAATTGMRRGELLGLQWQTVNLDHGTLRVERQQLADRTFGPPKSRRSERTIALDPGTVESLRQHRATQQLERGIAGDVYADRDLVFCDEIGHPLSPGSLTKTFHVHRTKAGIPVGTLHTLRHTAATIALTATPPVPLHVVAARLGDKPETLLGVYAHLLPSSDSQAADAVASAILVDKPLTTAGD